MSSKILLRRGTAAEWLSANPILSNGEVGVETDTLKFKIGNGTSTWTQLLSYANVTPSTLSSSLSDYILSADLGVAGGPSKLNSSGNLIIPESSIILWNDDAYTYTTTLTATQPTANRTITLPNATGTVALVSDVTNAINNLINAAPSALDTLNELAAAINNDSSFSTTVNNLLTGKVSKSGGDTITSATSSTIGLVIKGATSQSANLQEWQDSSGTVIAKIDANGKLRSDELQGIYNRIGIYQPTILAPSSTNVALIVKGQTSQSANLQEWQDSSGSTLLYISANADSIFRNGNFYLRTLNNNSINIQPYVSAGSPVATFNYNSIIFGTQAPITAASASSQGLIIKGVASQSANLQEWQDSTGTVLAKMSIYGLSMQAGNNIGADYFTSRTNGGGAYLIINGLSVTAQQRDASYPTFIVKGVASQTANLQEWQNSSGTVLAKVDAGGYINSSQGIKASNYGYIYTSNTQGSVSFLMADGNAGYVPLVIKGVTSQTADLQQWQASSGAAIAKIDAYGTFQNGTATGYGAWINVQPAQASDKGIIVRGAVSQTANLQEWQNSSGTTLLSVSSDGVLNKTGATYIGPQLWFTDPGVGNETKFVFSKTSDSAWLTVKERSSDNTYYEFGMSDNALDGGDYFQWTMSQWTALGMGWMPIQLGSSGGKSQTLRFTGEQSAFYSNLLVPLNSPFYTYLGDNYASSNYEVNKWIPSNSTSINLRRFESTGSSATFNVDLSGYTYSGRMGYKITIDSGATTFSYSTYGGDSSSGSAITITAGSWQTLSNGVKIKIGSGALAGENWSFVAFPTPRFAIGGAVDTSALAVIKPIATDKGLVIKSDTSQSANLQEWQNSSGSVLVRVAGNGDFVATTAYISTLFTGAGISGSVGQANVSPFSASTIGLVVRGAASQSANLQEWQDSAGTVVTKVTSGGNIDTTIQISGRSAVTAGTGNYLSASLSVIPLNASIIGAVIKAYPSQTANLQEWQNSSGASRTAILSDGSLFSNMYSTFTNAGAGGGNAIYVRTIYASDVPLAVRGAASQTANLQEWQNSSGTVLARVQSDGAFVSDYITAGQYLTSLNKLRTGGATSYGAQLEVTSTSATNIGAVIRGATSQTANLQEWQNSSGVKSVWVDQYGQLTTGYYFTNFGGGSMNLGLVTISGTGNIIPLAIRGVSGQTLSLQEWQNSSGTVLAKIASDGQLSVGSGTSNYLSTYDAYGNITSRSAGTNYGANISVLTGSTSYIGLVIRGQASQTANLQEWQISNGSVDAAIIPSKGLLLNLGNDLSGSQNLTQISFGYNAPSSPTGYWKHFITTNHNSGSSSGNSISFYTSDGTQAGVYPTNAVLGLSVTNGGIVSPKANINISSASTVGLTVKGAASQTANLQEWQNSSGTVTARFTKDGEFFVTDAYVAYFSGASNYSATLNVQTAQTNYSGIVIRGKSGQTANLQEWQDSNGTVYAFINPYGQLSIGQSPTIYSNARISLNTVATSVVGMVIRGVASQSANLQEWQNSSGTVLVSVTASGVLNAPLVTNAQTVSYTLVLADAGKMVEMNSASANTLTVPTNATVGYAIGTQINILQVGSGQTTVAGASGVTINAAPGLKLRTQWSSATLIKRATDTWVLVGDLSA